MKKITYLFLMICVAICKSTFTCPTCVGHSKQGGTPFFAQSHENITHNQQTETIASNDITEEENNSEVES